MTRAINLAVRLRPAMGLHLSALALATFAAVNALIRLL